MFCFKSDGEINFTSSVEAWMLKVLLLPTSLFLSFHPYDINGGDFFSSTSLLLDLDAVSWVIRLFILVDRLLEKYGSGYIFEGSYVVDLK